MRSLIWNGTIKNSPPAPRSEQTRPPIMKPRSSSGSSFCLAFSLALAATLPAWAEKLESNLDKTFNVNPGGKLLLRVDRGPISVTTSDANQVSIRVYRSLDTDNQSKADEAFADHEVLFKQQGNTVEVTAKSKKAGADQGSGTSTRTVKFLFFKFQSTKKWGGAQDSPLQARYEIVVPRRFNLDLKTQAGAIETPDLQGEARAETSGGELRFGHVSGPVWGKTFAGTITVASAEAVEVNTSGGSIEIGDVERGVRAETYSGHINIKSAKAALFAKTSGGNIAIDTAGGSLQAETYSGSVRVKSVAGMADVKTSGGDLVVGQAGKDVTALTFSGAITIDSAKGRVNAKNSGGGIKVGTAGGDVVAVTYSGNVSVDECGGKVEVKSSGGNITLGETAGNVSAETYSGMIRLKRTGGSVVARNSGGSIDLGELGGAADAKTFAGGIRATLPAKLKGTCLLETSSGDIKLDCPQEIAADLSARAHSGHVVAEIPVTVQGEQRRGQMQGKLNGGGPSLMLNAGSGSIYLRRR